MIPVLDKGYVNLVDHMGNDLSIVRAARVSYNAAWRAGIDEGSDSKLINYLWKNKHTTPFEAVTFTFEIYAPIFVFRQWHRHRTWSYNELSGRYKELNGDFYIPQVDVVGTQSHANKQGRDLSMLNPEDRSRVSDIEDYIIMCNKAYIFYQDLLAKNWPRELARMVLPLSTYSHMFATVNLLNLFKFLTLRMHPHAQYEIRQYAYALRDLITPIVPVAMAAYNENQG
jgi:thymidylate synthase (FAD)